MNTDAARFNTDAARFDVLTIGRVGVDLYPLQSGTPLQDVETFGKFLGGSPANVAVAAARHGRRSAVITRTGRDPFGTFIHQALRDLGVDDRFVSGVDGLPTPITFCEIFPPDDFPLYFYRYPVAPDLQIRASELDLDAVRSASIYWSTVTGLSVEPSRSAHFAAWEARGRAPLTILDLDYRPTFWDDPAEAHAQVDRALSMVTVAVGNREECEVAVGESDPDRAPGECWPGPATSESRSNRFPSRWSMVWAPVMPLVVRSATGCSAAGPWKGSSASPTSRARSWLPGWSARPPCRRSPRSRPASTWRRRDERAGDRPGRP
jgi:hypothetical protein